MGEVPPNLRWYQGITRAQWLAMLAAVLGWMFDGFEMGLHPLVARPALRELLEDSLTGVRSEVQHLPAEEAKKKFDEVQDRAVARWNSYLTAIFLFGAAAGGLVFGWLGDRVGRTRAMIYSVLAYSAFTGLGGFAAAPWQLAVARFLSALGMGGEWALGVALVMETWPARARPMLAGFIGAAANVGFLLIGVVSLFLGQFQQQEVNWRWLMFIGVLPALLTFFIRMFVPESEKWKHAVAGAPKPQVREIFARGLARRTLLAILLSGIALLGTWGSVQWIPLWTGQLTDPLPAEAKTFAKEYAQIYSAFGACVGTVAAALVAGRFGRRWTYVVLCLLSLASTAWLFRTQQTYGGMFFFYVFLVGLTTASFYGWIPLYLPELFPTRVRATGQGLSYNFGRIFAGVGTLLLTGPLADYFKGNLAPTLATVTLIYVLGLAVIWLAPETHGKPLPD